MYIRSSGAALLFVLAGAGTAAAQYSSNCFDPSTPLVGAAGAVEAVAGIYGFNCSLPTGGGKDSRWDTRAFIGVAVSLGTGARSNSGDVHLTAGVRRTRIDTENRVYGSELHGSINVRNWRDAQIRVLGLAGNRNILGNAGVGVDFLKMQPLATAGAQITHARTFVDAYVLERSIRAFIEANTYSRIDPLRSAPSCISGGTLANEQQAAAAFNAAAGSSFISGGLLTGTVVGFPISATPSAAWLNGQTCVAVSPPA